MPTDPKPTMKNIRFETENGRPMVRNRPARVIRLNPERDAVMEFESYGSMHNIIDINETRFAKSIPKFHGRHLDWEVLHPLLRRRAREIG